MNISKSVKKLTALSLLGLICFSLAGAALAAESETTPVNAPVPALVSVAAAPSENPPASLNKVNKLSTLIDKGIALISARLNSLVTLRKKVAGSKLTEEQKTGLLSIIDESAAGLTALVGQIKVGTDIKVVREQVKGIFNNYRIYAVVIPQINTLLGLYGLQNQVDSFNSNIFTKVQERLTLAQTKGKDITARQAALDNAKAMAGDIQTNITYTLKEITALKPADYPKTSSAVLRGGRSAFKDIHRAFLKLKTFLRGTGVVR